MKKQTGFTITELMVGLTLAMILAFAVGTVYTQTRQSFRLQTAQTRLVEQGRYAIAIFQKMATQAGYRNEALVINKPITDASLFNGLVVGKASGEIQFMFTGNSASAPNVIILCDGNDAAAASAPLAGYYTNTLSKDGSKLVCHNGTKYVDLLPDNVVDFAVTFGEDTSATKDKIPDVYTSTPTDYKNVYAAKMCIVIKGDAISGNTLETTQSYIDCAGSNQTATDKRLYRRFDTTVYLRNRFD